MEVEEKIEAEEKRACLRFYSRAREEVNVAFNDRLCSWQNSNSSSYVQALDFTGQWKLLTSQPNLPNPFTADSCSG